MRWLEMNRVGSPFGAWVVLVVEFLWQLKDEHRLIWRTPCSTVKAAYLVSRYLPLSSQLVNTILVFHVIGSPSTPSRVCRAWLIFQYGIVLITGALLQGVLLLRLCALYRHTRSVRVASSLLFIAQRIMSIAVFIYFTLFQATFDPNCSCQVSFTNIVDSISYLLVQTIIWLMTWKGTRPFAQHMAWAAIFVSFALVTPYITILRVDIQVVFAWPIAIMSIMTCRLILNILTLEPQSTPDSGPDINTQVSEDRIWDVMTTVRTSSVAMPSVRTDYPSEDILTTI